MIFICIVLTVIEAPRLNSLQFEGYPDICNPEIAETKFAIDTYFITVTNGYRRN